MCSGWVEENSEKGWMLKKGPEFQRKRTDHLLVSEFLKSIRAISWGLSK